MSGSTNTTTTSANGRTKAATPGAAKKAGARERRRSTRFPLQTSGKVGDVAVMVFDVSLGGIGFRTEHAFEADSEHVVVIGNGPMYLEGRVRIASVRPRKDGTFDVGAEFVG